MRGAREEISEALTKTFAFPPVTVKVPEVWRVAKLILCLRRATGIMQEIIGW